MTYKDMLIEKYREPIQKAAVVTSLAAIAVSEAAKRVFQGVSK